MQDDIVADRDVVEEGDQDGLDDAVQADLRHLVGQDFPHFDGDREAHLTSSPGAWQPPLA